MPIALRALTVTMVIANCACQSSASRLLQTDVTAAANASLSVNDVSIIFPRPLSQSESDELLKLSSIGAHGALLTEPLFENLPKLVGILPNFYDGFSIVALRVDPCFPGPPTTSCRRQVRLIAQPIRPNTGATDVALHLFYDLSLEQFREMVGDLRALKRNSPASTVSAKLGIHPGIATAGFSSDYFRAWKSFILRYTGVGNLRRIAFSGVFEVGGGWPFGAFEVRNDTATPDPIPRLGVATTQTFAENPFTTPSDRQGSFDPAATQGQLLDAILSTRSTLAAPSEAVTEAVRFAYSVENPRLQNSTTVDCASCHVAPKVRRDTQRLRNIGNDFPERYRDAPEMDRDENEIDTSTNVRAFGWKIFSLSISQRTLNESVEVARAIDQEFPPTP